MRDRPLRWIGLVLSNDPENLLAAIIADDRDGVTEASGGVILRLRYHHRGGAPRHPVPEVPTGARQPCPVANRLRRCIGILGSRQRRFNLLQALSRNFVRVAGDRPIWQLLNFVRVLDECSAHGQATHTGFERFPYGSFDPSSGTTNVNFAGRARVFRSMTIRRPPLSGREWTRLHLAFKRLLGGNYRRRFSVRKIGILSLLILCAVAPALAQRAPEPDVVPTEKEINSFEKAQGAGREVVGIGRSAFPGSMKVSFQAARSIG